MLTSALLLYGVEAHAGPRECIDAHERGQVQRKSLQLLDAKKSFLACSADADCPAPVKSECVEFLAGVEDSIPSLVFSAVDAAGKDTTQVRVVVDGRTVRETLDGRALPMDPGSHSIEMIAADGQRKVQRIVLNEGQKRRPVRLDLSRSRPGPEPETTETGPALLPYVLGGVGVAALGSFAYFGLDGRSREQELEGCTPFCDKADADAMQRSYLFADISLGVAVVALGTATVMLLSGSNATEGRAQRPHFSRATPQSASLSAARF